MAGLKSCLGHRTVDLRRCGDRCDSCKYDDKLSVTDVTDLATKIVDIVCHRDARTLDFGAILEALGSRAIDENGLHNSSDFLEFVMSTMYTKHRVKSVLERLLALNVLRASWTETAVDGTPLWTFETVEISVRVIMRLFEID